MCPLSVGHANSVPGQQAARSDLGEQRGVKDATGGLSHQQTTPSRWKSSSDVSRPS